MEPKVGPVAPAMTAIPLALPREEVPPGDERVGEAKADVRCWKDECAGCEAEPKSRGGEGGESSIGGSTGGLSLTRGGVEGGLAGESG